MFPKFKLGAVAGVAAFLAFQNADVLGQAPTTKVSASKFALTPENFHTVHALVRPQQTEWRHLQVRWMTDVVAARRQAAKEDKPIVVLYTGGAGYNEPLGVC